MYNCTTQRGARTTNRFDSNCIFQKILIKMESMTFENSFLFSNNGVNFKNGVKNHILHDSQFSLLQISNQPFGQKLFHGLKVLKLGSLSYPPTPKKEKKSVDFWDALGRWQIWLAWAESRLCDTTNAT